MVPGLVPLGSGEVSNNEMLTSLTICLVPGLVPLGSCKRRFHKNVQKLAQKIDALLGSRVGSAWFLQAPTLQNVQQFVRKWMFCLVPGLAPLGSCKRRVHKHMPKLASELMFSLVPGVVPLGPWVGSICFLPAPGSLKCKCGLALGGFTSTPQS